MTDTREIRKAAERVRRLNAGDESKIVYRYAAEDERLDDEDCYSLERKRIRDYKLLADAFLDHLAQHAADEEPVTEEWLDSIGICYDDEWERRYIQGLPNVPVLHCEKNGTDWAIGDWQLQPAIQPTTRSDVLALLAALKIPTKEPAC